MIFFPQNSLLFENNIYLCIRNTSSSELGVFSIIDKVIYFNLLYNNY